MSEFGQPYLSHLHVNTKSKPLEGFRAAQGPQTLPLWEPPKLGGPSQPRNPTQPSECEDADCSSLQAHFSSSTNTL